MSVDLIKVKEKEFIKDYKKIMRMCIEEGDILPCILEAITVPYDKFFTEAEVEKMKITEEASSRRQQLFMEQEALLDNIQFTGDFQKYSDEINTVYNTELMNWIGRHPKYKSLLK